jgi:hypothetical protein
MTITQEISEFSGDQPNRDEDTQSEFSDHVDNYHGHVNTNITEINTWATQANAMADIMNTEIGSMYVGTSSTSVAIGTGSKTFTVNEASKAFVANASIRIVDAASPNTKYMVGTVTSYNTSTKSLIVNVTSVGGSGTLSNWLINVGGNCGRIQTVPVATASPSNKDTLVYNSVSGEYEPSILVGTLVGDVERIENNLILEAFRRMIGDSQVGADPYQDGWVDTLQDESNVDTGNCINQAYDASGDYYHNKYLEESYSETNKDGVRSTHSGTEYFGQAFASGAGWLKKVKFYLEKVGSPTGNCYAVLYAATGTVGTDAKPTGSALATSDAIDVTTIAAGSFSLYEFSFASYYNLSAGDYCILFHFAGGDAANCIQTGVDTSSPTHSGNECYGNGSSWNSHTYDGIFYFYLLKEMTLIFDAKEAEGEPDESKALFIMEDIDAATLNTDIKAWASLDDGANYEQITLEDVGDYESDQHIITGTEALTDRNDQTTRLKITTENAKEIRIHMISNMLKLQ